MAKPVARGYYDAVGDLTSEGLACKDETRAVQASRDETDINHIINKYLRTGELPQSRQGIFADIAHMKDLQGAIEEVELAKEAFMALPADVRRFFDNDPVKLVEFADDPANTTKLVELGLIDPPRKPAPAPVQGAKAGTEPASTPPKA
ncbi:VP3 [Kummerowia striata gokushovirus]|nr:VP3 [Kummerowia striata gokushovirus]